MKDAFTRLHEILGNQLRQEHLDLMDFIPLPTGSDRMVRLKTIEQILDEFEHDEVSEGYLIRVKREKKNSLPPVDESKPSLDGAYLPNGKMNVTYLTQNATLLFSAGEYGLSRNIYKAIHQSGEKTAFALQGIARCYEAEGKLEEARTHYEESIAYQPSLEAYQRVAAILSDLKRDLNAASTLERALSMKDLTQKQRFELHQSAGGAYARIKRYDEAERHFVKALALEPSADEIRSRLGTLAHQAGKPDQARRHFQDAIASNPKNANAVYGMALCLLEQGEKRAAHDQFAKSLDLQLNNATAVFHLVKLAYELKSYATSARVVENYVEIAPINCNLLYSLSGLQYHLGRMIDARRTAGQIIQMQSTHTGAQEIMKLTEATDGC